MAWGEPTPCPELGEGWLRFSKSRGSGERSERADFQWESPGGQKFRSLKAAQEAAAGGAAGGGAGAASSGKGGKAKKAKPAPKGLKVPYRRPGFAESQAAAAAAAQAAAVAQAVAIAETVCSVCNSGHDEPGNDILLCDGPGCQSALHMQCLEKPIYAVPSDDWLCPTCAPAAATFEPMMSPFSKERGLDRELQVLDGIDLGAWAREQSEMPPPELAAWAAPAWLTPEQLAGRACLVAPAAADAQAGREARLRAGLVLDGRRAAERGALCALVALAGRATPLWLAAAGGTLFVGGGLCLAPRPADKGEGALWPARVFHALAADEETAVAAAAAAVEASTGAGAGSSGAPSSPPAKRPKAGGGGGGGGGGRAGTAPRVLLKFFGGGEDGAVARVAASALRPWPRALAAPMVHEEGDGGHGRSQALY